MNLTELRSNIDKIKELNQLQEELEKKRNEIYNKCNHEILIQLHNDNNYEIEFLKCILCEKKIAFSECVFFRKRPLIIKGHKIKNKTNDEIFELCRNKYINKKVSKGVSDSEVVKEINEDISSKKLRLFRKNNKE